VRDEEGFARFVLESYAGLLRRAYLLVGDHGRAEDLVQTALAAAYPRWDRIDEPGAYLRTSMVRTAIGWRRRRWSAEQPTDRLPERVSSADPTGDTELAMVLHRALRSLPPEQRAVLVLRYYDDASESEIADLLGCSPGTVKSRAARALAALRGCGLLTEEEQAR
jgi:RNA polymerase sigma-70 factor (sigma-E family)